MGDRGEVRKRSRSERRREKKAAAEREPPRGSALCFSAAPTPQKPLRRRTHRGVKGWGWVVSSLYAPEPNQSDIYDVRVARIKKNSINRCRMCGLHTHTNTQRKNARGSFDKKPFPISLPAHQHLSRRLAWLPLLQ